MVQKFCQSCGMPLNNSNKGTNADGNPNEDYCIYCYKEGKFTQDFNMSQMIEFCTQFTDQINKEAGWNLTPQQAKEQMRQFFPTLKRWKQKDERSLTEKAAHLLSQCKEVTLASVNADGFPRPVPLDKIYSAGCNEVWVVTAKGSEKWRISISIPKQGFPIRFMATASHCVELLKSLPTTRHANRCGRNTSSIISPEVRLTRTMYLSALSAQKRQSG